MTVICGECGSKNDDDSDFCASCGEPLEWTAVKTPVEPVAVAAVETPPPPAPAPVEEAPAPAVAPPPAPAPVADTSPPPPPAPAKAPRFGRKPKTPPPPPPAVATPPPAPAAEAPLVEAPPVAPPVEEPVAPPAEDLAAPPSAVVPVPPPRVPPPRKPSAAPTGPTPEEQEAEAARQAEEAEQLRREELARRLVVPVDRPAAPVAAAAPVAVAVEPEKLTWWQRFVRWFKRVILRRKPAVAAVAVAAPVAAASTEAQEETVVAARAPTALKPGEEYERRVPRAVEEEVPDVKPGDLVCVNCGSGNAPTNKFCKRCGASLAEAEVKKKPSWIKRFFGFFAFRKRRSYAAGERKKKQQQAGEGGKGGGKIFWRLQSLSFKTIGMVFLAVAAIGAFAVFGPTIKGRFMNNYHALHARFLPTYTAVTGVRATASSHLNQAHSAHKAIDLVINTAWISKPTKNDGQGSILTMHLGQPTRVGKIGLDNGDQSKGTKTYPLQARVQTAVIVFFDKHGHKLEGKSKKCQFADKIKFQTCGMDVKGAEIIKFHITRVYPSQKGKSVAVAEFEVDSVK